MMANPGAAGVATGREIASVTAAFPSLQPLRHGNFSVTPAAPLSTRVFNARFISRMASTV